MYRKIERAVSLRPLMSRQIRRTGESLPDAGLKLFPQSNCAAPRPCVCIPIASELRPSNLDRSICCRSGGLRASPSGAVHSEHDG